MVRTNFQRTPGSSNSSTALPGDLRPIKAPVAIPNYWFWLGCVLTAALLATLAWWLWRRRQQRAVLPEAIVTIPPHDKARARLNEALALLDQPRPFCTAVSDTVRVYLEERFNLRAPERTTEEFLEELQSSALLGLEQKRALGDFLMRCDLVKFARYEPGRQELEAIYDSAVRLVEETRPAPALASGTLAGTPEAR